MLDLVISGLVQTKMRYKKIKDLVEEVLKPSVDFIKKSRNRSNMPYKEMGDVLAVFFPKTKHAGRGKGFFKHVFAIHFGKKKLALKMGRRRKDIRKDYTTYRQLCKRAGTNKANHNFAKIYWESELFMLQKYGKNVAVPTRELKRLKCFGERYGLKDIREANIMKFGRAFKIIDAERR